MGVEPQNSMKIRSFGFTVVLLFFAYFTAGLTTFNSWIGLLFCIAAFYSSLERTISNYNEKNGFFFVLGIFFILVSVSSIGFYYTMMTWD